MATVGGGGGGKRKRSTTGPKVGPDAGRAGFNASRQVRPVSVSERANNASAARTRRSAASRAAHGLAAHADHGFDPIRFVGEVGNNIRSVFDLQGKINRR